MPFFRRSHSSFYSGLRKGAVKVLPPDEPVEDFVNGDFEQGFTNWTTINKQVSPGGIVTGAVTEIKGCPVMADPTPFPIGVSFTVKNGISGNYPTPSPGQELTVVDDSNFTTEIVSGGPTGKFIRMTINGLLNLTRSGGTLYGPAVVSNNPVIANVGDRIRFNWTAEGGGDAFNVLAYLVDPTNACKTLLLLDQTGEGSFATTPWSTVSKVIGSGENGIYYFVFLCGTFDYSFGLQVGAKLSIDEIKVDKAGTY